ncbi:hypothetical protein J7438_20135 [Thalassotalea sp. G20_0]|uniref:hypothetical protein n=1 Tax=Thalassotalea sp. G20_0 TaxID=2821093 RepID=UPI001AD9DB52|nr:hypothetical protein [Thalassotalea sp. G20_0]MBO9496370.1 hypothetical protein [Thalassotalea sp. G20_0]
MNPVNSASSRPTDIPRESHVLPAVQQSSTNDSQGASGFFGQHQVRISELSKPLVLKCLWDNAKGGGAAYCNIKNPAILMSMRLLPEMDIKVAEQHIQNAQSKNLPLSFDYLDTKPLKINITGNDLDTQSYDYYHGDGSAKRAIEKAIALDCKEKHPEEFYEDAIFGYSGIRGNINTKKSGDLKQIYVPIHFIPDSGLYDLSLDGYPFHIEGTKDKIIEFLDKYNRFHFTAKSIEKKEQSKARVSMNIKLCLDDCDLPKNAGKMQENLGSEAAKQPEEIKSRKFDSTINKIRNELKRLNENETDIGTALSKNNFEVCSGPINLLHNIKKDQKIQIEFDRFESSNSPARLQINSTGSQVKFKDLSEALKVLFK